MRLYTIGFTQTTAETFFSKLRDSGVRTVVDTRIHRDGQLAGFAKVPDFPYFLRSLASIDYEVNDDLAPPAALLKRYREKKVSWDLYAAEYSSLLRERQPERTIAMSNLADSCLLCSEHAPEKCHRRLAAEYLREAFDGAFEIIHL